MTRTGLIVAAFLLALGSAGLHYTIHNPVPSPEQPLAFFKVGANALALFDLIVITCLFCFRRTVTLAYVFNGMLCIYGTVMMMHHSFVFVPFSLGLVGWIGKSLLKDIAILWADFFVGKAIFDVTFKVSSKPTRP